MTYLPGDLLVKADRMTMSHSLEARSPFLDHHVVDFAARLPERIKFRRGRQKHLLRRLLRRDFPRSFVDRRKQGFGVPLDKWFRDDLNEMMRESIEDSTLVEAGYLDRQAMRDVLAQHERGEANRQATLWGLLVLERWHREVISS
jgi:asparagine synthase (glutamine-hydrolysing)